MVDTFSGPKGFGAGSKPIACQIQTSPCAIAFDPPVSRVGFHWSLTTYDGESARNAVLFYRDGVETGRYDLIHRWDRLGFFGFEDAQGIDEIRVGG